MISAIDGALASMHNIYIVLIYGETQGDFAKKSKLRGFHLRPNCIPEKRNVGVLEKVCKSKRILNVRLWNRE